MSAGMRERVGVRRSIKSMQAHQLVKIDADTLGSLPQQLAAALDAALMRDIEFFRQCDIDGSGCISRAEFGRVLRKDLNLAMTKKQLKQIFAAFDDDGSDAINYEEMRVALRGTEAIQVSAAAPSREKRHSKDSSAITPTLPLAPPRLVREELLRFTKVAIRTDLNERFEAFELASGYTGTLSRGVTRARGSSRMAIVVHAGGSMEASGSGSSSSGLRMSRSSMHRRLLEAGWGILAYEDANVRDTAEAGKSDRVVQVAIARLRAALVYIASHRKFRYCKVALLTQGLSASAAFAAMSVAPSDFDFPLKALCVTDPAPLNGSLIGTHAPRCRLPVLLSCSDAGDVSLAEALYEALDAKLPKEIVLMTGQPLHSNDTQRPDDDQGSPGSLAQWQQTKQLMSFLELHVGGHSSSPSPMSTPRSPRLPSLVPSPRISPR